MEIARAGPGANLSGGARIREILFRAGVVLKGVNALVEIAGGFALWAISPGAIGRWVWLITQDELAEDRRDAVATYLRHAAARLSLGSQHFLVAYLLSHGVVKLIAVIALLRGKLWGYPLSLAVFGAFVAYQLYRLAIAASIGLIALTIFDLIVIWLILLEYRAVRVN